MRLEIGWPGIDGRGAGRDSRVPESPMPLRKALAICACLYFLGFLASPFALPVLRVGTPELEALALPIPQTGTTGFDALVFFGRIVGARGEMPPLMTRLFALFLLFVHGWLFWMAGCGVCERHFPFAYWKSLVGLILSTVLVGAITLGGAVFSGKFTTGAFLPICAIGFLFAGLWASRTDPPPYPSAQSPPETHKS